eukprot:355379-Pyramimonas_sp.AAC.1
MSRDNLLLLDEHSKLAGLGERRMSNTSLKLLVDERMERVESGGGGTFDNGDLTKEMKWLRQCLPIILQVGQQAPPRGVDISTSTFGFVFQ